MTSKAELKTDISYSPSCFRACSEVNTYTDTLDNDMTISASKGTLDSMYSCLVNIKKHLILSPYVIFHPTTLAGSVCTLR